MDIFLDKARRTAYNRVVVLFKKELRRLRDAFRILGEPAAAQAAVSGKAGACVQRIFAYAYGDTATDIVEDRHLTKSHVSASEKTLQARGYLQRVYLSGNRKTAHLHLAPAAEPVVEKGRRAQQAFFAALQKGLAPAERAALKSAFGKLLKNARAALEEGHDAV